MTVYRGLPYDLPAGLDLYSRYARRACPSPCCGPAQVVTDHKLRSNDDADDLVRQLETGGSSGSS